MNDDFNTPILIAQLFEGVKLINQIKEGKLKVNQDNLDNFKTVFEAMIFDVLGLEDQSEGQSDNALDAAMEVLIELRNQARLDKNWALSDEIRDQLAEKGIQLKDGKEGTSYSLN